MNEIIQYNLNDINKIKNTIAEKWKILESTENTFRYKLNIKEKKIVPGNFNFFCELNKERITLRRPPQIILSIQPKFNENEFNFCKINKNEILFNIKFNDDKDDADKDDNCITFLINNSPLTKHHLLIVPNLNNHLPQILTKDAIKFSIQILHQLNEHAYRIGYNSPGALASVNHLHLHLMYIEEKLYVENAPLKLLIKNLFQIDELYPAIGFCFPLTNINELNEISDDIFKLIQFLCKNNIPHNLFITYGKQTVNRRGGGGGTDAIGNDDNNRNNEIIKIFIYPRENACKVKTFHSFNIAFCELSGYIPVGSQEDYDILTEELIVEKIHTTTGNILDKIRDDVIKLYL